MQKNKTREMLIKMYLDSLKEDKMPFHKSWNTLENRNGITNKRYRGENSLLLSLISENEKYSDPRWYTFLQIKNKGWKLKSAKNKGVPVEFWSCYDKIRKRKIEYSKYQEIIDEFPERKKDFSIIREVSYVYNAKYIEGLPEFKIDYQDKKIEIPKYISNIFHNLKISYKEEGNEAYYDVANDTITLPPSTRFEDKYSYYATQLHELSHASGSKNRLNRQIENKFGTEDYAREELIAEIGSSFLMSKLNIKVGSKHYNNHKCYIQSWIRILEYNPNELFKAINEANKVFDYLDKNSVIKIKDKER